MTAEQPGALDSRLRGKWRGGVESYAQGEWFMRQ